MADPTMPVTRKFDKKIGTPAILLKEAAEKEAIEKAAAEKAAVEKAALKKESNEHSLSFPPLSQQGN